MRLLALIFLTTFVSAVEPVVTVTTDAAGTKTTTSTLTDESGPHTTTTVQDASGHLIKLVEPNGDARLYSFDQQEHIIRVDLVRGKNTTTMSILYADDGSIATVVLPDGKVCNCVGLAVRWENGYLLGVPDGRPIL